MEKDEHLSKWVAEAQEGNHEALDRLLELCRLRVRGYLRPYLSQEEDREDLTQQILLRVAHALPHTMLSVPFERWLMRIVVNCLRTFYRHKANDLLIPFSELSNSDWAELAQQASDEPNPEEQTTHRQFQERLRHIIRQVCSAEERQVIFLSEQVWKMEVIAHLLKMNLNTARSHLMRGRAKVLAYIVQHEPELVGGAEGIERAVQRLQQEGRLRERLTPQELRALHQPGRNQLLLRKACLKVAPFLVRCP